MNAQEIRSFPAGFFTGETTSWHVADAILSEVLHRKGKHVDPHVHEATYFSLLLEGTYSERGDGFDLRYEPYTVVFHDAGTLHEDDMGDNLRFFAVEMLPRWGEVIDNLGGAKAHVFELSGGDPVWLVLRLYREFLARESGTESNVEAILYELCSYVASRSALDTSEPAWLSGVDVAIRERFRESLDLEDLALRAAVHPAHLCRAYRQFRGQTISEARIGLRVQQACRLLTESNQPLLDIALECGFTDQSHMSRVFKRVTGDTPGAHRREERAKPVQE